MAPLSLTPSTFDGTYASGGVSENNPNKQELSAPQTPVLPVKYNPNNFQDLYDFITSGAAENDIRAGLSDLVNAGTLDPVNAAALGSLLGNPPNSVEDMNNRLPKLSPEEINNIIDVLVDGRLFKLSHEENELKIEGVGLIKGATGEEDSLTIELERTEISISNSNEPEKNSFAGAIEGMSRTQQAGASVVNGSDLQLAGEIDAGHQIEIRAGEFTVADLLAEDGQPSNLRNISVHNFSASGTETETGVEYRLFAERAEAEIELDTQSGTGTARDINFALVKDEHQLNGLVNEIDFDTDNDAGTNLGLSGKADTPALIVNYRNDQNNAPQADLTIDRGFVRSKDPLFSGGGEPVYQPPSEFYFQDVRLQTEFGSAASSELSGDLLNWRMQNFKSAGAYNEHQWSASVAEISYAENDADKALNATKLAVNYQNARENFQSALTLDALTYSRRPGATAMTLTGFQAQFGKDIYASFDTFNFQYSQTNDWRASVSGLASWRGDYGLYIRNVSAGYTAAGKKLAFKLDNIHGAINLDKPLPPLPQDLTRPEVWQDYLQALNQNNVTYAGSINDLGGFITQNVYLKHLPHQQALSAVAPHLAGVAFSFDEKLTTHLMDDAGADTVVWLNEYTNGFIGQQANQFVDAYLAFGQNVYRRQHGYGLADGYYRQFDLSATFPKEEKVALGLTLAADPQNNYASVALDYSASWFEASYGYTHKSPVDAAPDLSILGVNYLAEHIFNSRISWGSEFLRLNVDTALTVGKWSLGDKASGSLGGLLDAYDLMSLLPADENKWWVTALLNLPVMPFVSPSLSSRIRLPFNLSTGFDIAWRPRLENYGHERSLLENISWDNFLASIYLAREVAEGLSLKLEVLLRINRLFSSEVSAQMPGASLLVEINKGIFR